MAANINLVDYNSTTAFWTFMIYCLVVVFVAVFFLFFASRVFAQLLSKLIRWFTWRHMKAYIEFGMGTPLKHRLRVIRSSCVLFLIRRSADYPLYLLTCTTN